MSPDRGWRPSRRGVLHVLAAGAASAAGCGDSSPDLSVAGPADCQASSGTDAGYCLVVPVRIRIPGGASLGVGEALLANVDDNTAVILARDDKGFHALSAVCTHACCLVALCEDAACTQPSSTPGDCARTAGVPVRQDVASILCPCHNSGFRVSDGQPLTGPALKPLPSYAVSLDGPDALVDTGRVVDAAARV